MIKRVVFTLGGACLLTLAFLWGAHGTAQANSLVYTDTVITARLNWTDTMTIPQFDPSFGILTGVELSVTSHISGVIGYELQPSTPASFVSLQVNATTQITPPNNTPLAAGGNNVATFSENAAAFDGSIDFNGPSGTTFPYTRTVTNAILYTASGDLAPFIGLGSVTLPTRAFGSFTAAGGTPNLIAFLLTDADANVEVRYLYTIPQIVIQKLTNGFDANNPNDPDVPQIQPGDMVTWTYIVTNTGSIAVPLAQITVTDSQLNVTPVRVSSSDVNNDGLLAPGEAWLYRATGTVQNLAAPVLPVTIVSGCNPSGSQAPGNRPTYRNIGTVVVPGATANDPSHYCNPPRPGIAILKLTNGFDANNPHGSDVPQIAPGAAVIWTYVVTNTGNITFTQAQVVVTDSQLGVTPALTLGSDLNSDGLLAPGEVWRYTATGNAANLQTPPAGISVVAGCNPDASSAPGPRNAYRNIGTVTVPGATDNDPSHYCNPARPGITIVKLTNGFDANSPNGNDVPQIAPGASVVWSYLVTNTGNITFTLAQVAVSDSQAGITPLRQAASDSNNDNLLAPGEVWRYQATGTAGNLAAPSTGITVVAGCNPSAAQAPGMRNTYRNIGTVIVPGATASDPSHYCNPAAPGIAIKKYTNGADADKANGNDVPRILPGETVTWTYVVTNTGNITFTLAQVVVSDDQSGVTPLFVASSDNGDNLLVPGERWLYRAVGSGLDLKAQPVGVSLEVGCGLSDPPFNNAYTNIGTVRVPGATATDPSHYCNPLPTSVDVNAKEPGRLLFLPLIQR